MLMRYYEKPGVPEPFLARPLDRFQATTKVPGDLPLRYLTKGTKDVVSLSVHHTVHADAIRAGHEYKKDYSKKDSDCFRPSMTPAPTSSTTVSTLPAPAPASGQLFNVQGQPFPCDFDTTEDSCEVPVSPDCAVGPLWDMTKVSLGGGTTLSDMQKKAASYACNYFAVDVASDAGTDVGCVEDEVGSTALAPHCNLMVSRTFVKSFPAKGYFDYTTQWFDQFFIINYTTKVSNNDFVEWHCPLWDQTDGQRYLIAQSGLYSNPGFTSALWKSRCITSLTQKLIGPTYSITSSNVITHYPIERDQVSKKVGDGVGVYKVMVGDRGHSADTKDGTQYCMGDEYNCKGRGNGFLQAASPHDCYNYCMMFADCDRFQWFQMGCPNLGSYRWGNRPEFYHAGNEWVQKDLTTCKLYRANQWFRVGKPVQDPPGDPLVDSSGPKDRPRCLNTNTTPASDMCTESGNACMVSFYLVDRKAVSQRADYSNYSRLVEQYVSGHANIDRLFTKTAFEAMSRIKVTVAGAMDERSVILSQAVEHAVGITTFFPIEAGDLRARYFEARGFLSNAVSCYFNVMEEMTTRDVVQNDEWKAKILTCRRMAPWATNTEDSEEEFKLPSFSNPTPFRANPWRADYDPMNEKAKNQFHSDAGLESEISKALKMQKRCQHLGTWTQLRMLGSTAKLSWINDSLAVDGKVQPQSSTNELVTKCAITASNDRAFKFANDELLAENHVASALYIRLSFVADVILAVTSLIAGCVGDMVGPVFASAVFVLEFTKLVIGLIWDEAQLKLDALLFTIGELATGAEDLASDAQRRADANAAALVTCELDVERPLIIAAAASETYEAAAPHRDIPSAAFANIVYDALNDEFDFTATGAIEMFFTRRDAPIMWKAIPPGLAIGSVWTVDTQVRIIDAAAGGQKAGITFYGGPDGAKPAFDFGLDVWSPQARTVRLQGLGIGTPDIPTSLDASLPLTTAVNQVFLRVVVREGGETDTYNFYYKKDVGDAWLQITGQAVNFRSKCANSRVGIVYRTNAAKPGAAFKSFEVSTIMMGAAFETPPPPPPPPPPTPPLFTITSGPCTVDSSSPNCILSPNFPSNYGHKQTCFITPSALAIGRPLTATSFSTEYGWDYLRIPGQPSGVLRDFEGTVGPSNFVLGPGMIQWSSDDVVSSSGWRVCSLPQSPPSPRS